MRLLNGLVDGVVFAWTLLLGNFAVILSMAAVCFIVYILATSKPARLMVKAIKNSLIKWFSQIPYVASALYDEDIRRCQSLLKDWENEEKEEQTTLASYKSELAENNVQIAKWERNLESALSADDEVFAMENAENIVNAQKANKRLIENDIPGSEAAIKEIRKRQSEARVLINKARMAKKERMRDMKRGKREEEHTDKMRGRDDIQALLKNFEEKSQEQKNRAIGARMAYENTLEHKEYVLEQGAAQQEARALISQMRQKKLETRR